MLLCYALPAIPLAAVALPLAAIGRWCWLSRLLGHAAFGYTGTLLPYTAWGAELSTDYRGRSVVSAFREGATLIGTLIAVVLPFTIGLDSINGFHGLAAVAVLTIVLLPAAGALAVTIVPEPANRSTKKLSLKDSLGFVVRNRPFVRLIVAFLLNGFAKAIPATLFLYFVSERLGAIELRGPLLFLYFLCGILGVPMAVWLSAKAGKHRTWCGAMFVACLVFSCAGFLRAGDIVAFAIICVATGLLLGFDLALPPAIQADVIDYDTGISGEQRSGLYFAAWGLATKLSVALSVGLVFPILAWSGFDGTGTEATPEAALDTLSVLNAWFPIMPKVAAIAVMWNFPLGEDVQRALRAGIASSTDRRQNIVQEPTGLSAIVRLPPSRADRKET